MRRSLGAGRPAAGRPALAFVRRRGVRSCSKRGHSRKSAGRRGRAPPWMVGFLRATAHQGRLVLCVRPPPATAAGGCVRFELDADDELLSQRLTVLFSVLVRCTSINSGSCLCFLVQVEIRSADLDPAEEGASRHQPPCHDALGAVTATRTVSGAALDRRVGKQPTEGATNKQRRK